jgi:hypothetical protein
MSLNSINQVAFVVAACVLCVTATDGKHTNIWLQNVVTVTICNRHLISSLNFILCGEKSLCHYTFVWVSSILNRSRQIMVCRLVQSLESIITYCKRLEFSYRLVKYARYAQSVLMIMCRNGHYLGQCSMVYALRSVSISDS